MSLKNSQDKSSDSPLVVSVAFPVAIPGVYDYAVPEPFRNDIHEGTPVLVTVRNRKIWGVALKLKTYSEFSTLKPVLEIKTGTWSDQSSSLIKLYEWIADYYQCDMGRVFKPIVSKGIITKESKTVTTYTKASVALPVLRQLYLDALEKLPNDRDFTISEAVSTYDVKESTVKYLAAKQLLVKGEREVIRTADEMSMPIEADTHSLSSEQQAAFDTMKNSIGRADKPYLLHGITGSGKTHVYIALTSYALQLGKSVMILVPEISLTPQTIARFRASLGDIMTVIHSNMSDGERRDSLQELVTGAKKVVVGVRSAILAPMDNVGLIIVDEEHDGSYKQSDLEPRYNARDVAVMRGFFQKALVVLGSATPGIESFYNAQSGKYHYIKLSQRYGAGVLPDVHIVNMTKEHDDNNWTIISRHLADRIDYALSIERQIILLLNRRGFSTVLICKECGHTCVCPNCSVSIRYHKNDNSVKCHFCGFQQHAPEVCPNCQGQQIKYKGTGIQKAEEFIKEQFPHARILRMDQDTTRRKGSHIEILNEFASGNADILIGTQMVSKGLNFPGVAVVGVITADTGLHLPDFRASERTFQLLTQVAGRAGRADNMGEVIVQTYFPEEIAINYAQKHDYEAFYANEITSREDLKYPPFSKLSRILVEGTDENLARSVIYEIALFIKKMQVKELLVLGPTPAAIAKIDTWSRFNMLLKSPNPKLQTAVLAQVRSAFAKQPKSIRVVVDVDPYNML
jgi:primosomal protein N' (replication factor Y) (superfamily II helicase)